MYAYLKSLALPHGAGASWESTDLSSVLCGEIATTYYECYFTLTNPFLEKQQILKLSDVYESVSNFTGTLTDWLIANGNKTLPTTEGEAMLSAGESNYRTVFHAGFTVTPFDHSKHPDTELSRNEEYDLLLRKEGVDYYKMSKCILATVNGLFHRTGLTEHGYVVYEGGRSANHCKQNLVGLLSFEHVSNFTTYTIEDSWFKRPIAGLKYSERVFLKTPESLVGKTVFLVLAGFLIPTGDALVKVSDDVLSLSVNRMSVEDRYYIANQLIDFNGHITLDTLGADDSRRSSAEIESDLFIKQLLTLSQSFLVVFDNPAIAIEREAVETLKVPGRWLLHKDPKGLLQVDYGLAPEYNISKEPDNRYVLQSMPMYHNVLIKNTRRHGDAEIITSQKYGRQRHRLVDAYLTTFSSETVTIVPV